MLLFSGYGYGYLKLVVGNTCHMYTTNPIPFLFRRTRLLSHPKGSFPKFSTGFISGVAPPYSIISRCFLQQHP